MSINDNQNFTLLIIAIAIKVLEVEKKNSTIIINQEMICGKELSLNANGRSTKTGMIVHPKEESSM